MNIARNILDAFGQLIVDPIFWPFAFFIPIFVILCVFRKNGFASEDIKHLKFMMVASSSLVLLGFFATCFSYLYVNFINNGYAVLYAITSWLFYHGKPVYSDGSAHQPYSLPYGPIGYILVSGFQYAFTPGIFSSKLPAYLASLASFLFLYWALRAKSNWVISLFLTAFAAGLLITFKPLQYWPRPEPFLFLCVTVGLWASTRSRLWSLVILGISAGFAINLKIYALALFLPMFADVFHNRKIVITALSAGIPLLFVVCIPFALSNISLANYLLILKIDGSVPFRMGELIGCYKWWTILGLISFAPLIIIDLPLQDKMSVIYEKRYFIAGLLLAILAISYPASRETTGPHHLIPFIPIMLYLSVAIYSEVVARTNVSRQFALGGTSLFCSMWIVVAGYAILQGLVVPGQLIAKDKAARQQVIDLGEILQKKSGYIILNATGSRATVNDESYRALLVFNGMPVGIDPVSSMDYKYFHNFEPDLPTFIADLKMQYHRPIMWICPKGAVPFSLISFFGAEEPVFSSKFTNDFKERFAFSGSSKCFDLYEEK